MGQDDIQREVLPIPDREYPGLIAYDAKDPQAKFPPIRPLRPPEGAPNVLVVLIDDVGFGASSAFGGPCSTPTFERLAAAGLTYTRFHTTAICSPTRAALLSGRNHHAVGMGGITEMATSAPGYNSMRPNSCAPLPEILKLNGYATAHSGEYHEVPVWESSPIGPFDRWPTGTGFEHFYGFLGGETNQWYPGIYEGTSPVEPWGMPEDGYHFMDDMTNKAILWAHEQKAMTPDKPFFVYYAPSATHAPTMCPRSGPTSTGGSSTRAGTRCGGRPSPAGAAPATRPSSTGRPGSRPGGRSATSSTTSWMSPRPCWRRPVCPSRAWSTACCRSRCTG